MVLRCKMSCGNVADGRWVYVGRFIFLRLFALVFLRRLFLEVGLCFLGFVLFLCRMEFLLERSGLVFGFGFVWSEAGLFSCFL